MSVTARPATRSTAPLGRLLRSELRTALCRRRTLVALGVLALVPVLIGAGVAAQGSAGTGRVSGLITAASGNGLLLPVAALAATLDLLLPLAVSLAAADILAGEAACGALRGRLLAPVSRPRLVAVKACAVCVVAVLAVLVVALVGLATGAAVLGGAGQLLTLSGSVVGTGDALARIALAVGWTALQVAAVGAVALAVSSVTDHPLVVVASVLGGAIGFGVLDTIPSLGWLHPWLLTTAWTALPDVLRDPMPTDGLLRGALLAAGYLVVGLVAAVAGLVRREG
ncbi:MAG TPA: ABC transporter permease subunit [Pseudonocardia sp.]|jgi:ABC-2 type transport system permease protein